jgi:hypothetical protein
MRGFSAIATRQRWKKIGKTKAGRKIPIYREPVDELAGSEPVLPVNRAVVQVRDHRVGAAEGQEPRLLSSMSPTASSAPRSGGSAGSSAAAGRVGE